MILSKGYILSRGGRYLVPRFPLSCLGVHGCGRVRVRAAMRLCAGGGGWVCACVGAERGGEGRSMRWAGGEG